MSSLIQASRPPERVRKYRRFEYKSMEIETRFLSDRLNAEGFNGWELIQTGPSFSQDRYVCYFKREVFE